MSVQRVKKLVGNIQLLLHDRHDTHVNYLKCKLPLFKSTGSSNFVNGVFRPVEFESTDKVFIDGLVEKLWSAQITTSNLLFKQ